MGLELVRKADINFAFSHQVILKFWTRQINDKVVEKNVNCYQIRKSAFLLVRWICSYAARNRRTDIEPQSNSSTFCDTTAYRLATEKEFHVQCRSLNDIWTLVGKAADRGNRLICKLKLENPNCSVFSIVLKRRTRPPCTNCVPCPNN